MKKSTNIVMAGMLSFALLFSGCKSMSDTLKGGMIGTAGGALIGAGIGKLAGNTAAGAIAGAAVGGTTGALIGRHMDKQAAELKTDLNGANVERVGEGIKITFDSGILFTKGSSELSAASKANLDKMAETLNKYADTKIIVAGHTDDTGSDAFNQTLSEKRAAAVVSYLAGKNVAADRLTGEGFGESQPVVANDSDENRAKNRRVEVAIFANEKMVKAAEKGTLGEVK